MRKCLKVLTPLLSELWIPMRLATLASCESMGVAVSLMTYEHCSWSPEGQLWALNWKGSPECLILCPSVHSLIPLTGFPSVQAWNPDAMLAID